MHALGTPQPTHWKSQSTHMHVYTHAGSPTTLPEPVTVALAAQASGMPARFAHDVEVRYCIIHRLLVAQVPQVPPSQLQGSRAAARGLQHLHALRGAKVPGGGWVCSQEHVCGTEGSVRAGCSAACMHWACRWKHAAAAALGCLVRKALQHPATAQPSPTTRVVTQVRAVHCAPAGKAI